MVTSESQIVDSYKFWDIVVLWGRERLVHEVIIAQELALGVVKDGLRFQSFNPNFMKPSEELKAYPYVGYSAHQTDDPIIIRAEVLQHLLAIVYENKEPLKDKLNEEYVTKSDFRKWLVKSGNLFPEFWFSSDETAPKQ